MGYHATCTLRIDGRSFAGEAALEPRELRFRGDLRLAIPLAALDHVVARDGCLTVSFGGRRALFEMGADAERWAQRIISPRQRVQKLGIKAGMQVALDSLADRALLAELEAAGASIVSGSDGTALDVIFFAPRTVADLAAVPRLATRLKPAGALWVLRPKGAASPIRERDSMAAGHAAGLVDVKVVSYSDTLSAEKYVIPVAKRAAARRGGPAAPRKSADRQSRGRTPPER